MENAVRFVNQWAARGLMLALGVIVSFVSVNSYAQSSILNSLGTPQEFSTVPGNGDLNPYGIAFVPAGFPATTGSLLEPGDILVSVRCQPWTELPPPCSLAP